MTILIKYRNKIISSNRNYNFLSKFNITLESSDDFFAHIVNTNIKTIQVKNVFNKVFIISKIFLIDKLQNYDKNNCYLAYSKNIYLAIILLLE